MVFRLAALLNQNEVDPRRVKEASFILYGHLKSGTRARVFSQTLAHGNSNNEGRQRNRKREAEKSENEKARSKLVPKA